MPTKKTAEWEAWKTEWESVKNDWTQISLTPGSDAKVYTVVSKDVADELDNEGSTYVSNKVTATGLKENYTAQSDAVRSDTFNWETTLQAAVDKSGNKASFVVSAGDQIQTTKAKSTNKDAAKSEIEYSGYLSPDIYGSAEHSNEPEITNLRYQHHRVLKKYCRHREMSASEVDYFVNKIFRKFFFPFFKTIPSPSNVDIS